MYHSIASRMYSTCSLPMNMLVNNCCSFSLA